MKGTHEVANARSPGRSVRRVEIWRQRPAVHSGPEEQQGDRTSLPSHPFSCLSSIVSCQNSEQVWCGNSAMRGVARVRDVEGSKRASMLAWQPRARSGRNSQRTSQLLIALQSSHVACCISSTVVTASASRKLGRRRAQREGKASRDETTNARRARPRRAKEQQCQLKETPEHDSSLPSH